MSIPEQEAGDCSLMNSPLLLEDSLCGKSVPKTVALQLCDLTTETRCKRQTTTVREKVSDEHLHIYSACSVTLTNKDASIHHSTIWQTVTQGLVLVRTDVVSRGARREARVWLANIALGPEFLPPTVNLEIFVVKIFSYGLHAGIRKLGITLYLFLCVFLNIMRVCCIYILFFFTHSKLMCFVFVCLFVCLLG